MGGASSNAGEMIRSQNQAILEANVLRIFNLIAKALEEKKKNTITFGDSSNMIVGPLSDPTVVPGSDGAALAQTINEMLSEGKCDSCPGIGDFLNTSVITHSDGNDYILFDNKWLRLPKNDIVVDHWDPMEAENWSIYTLDRENYTIMKYMEKVLYPEIGKGALYGAATFFTINGYISWKYGAPLRADVLLANMAIGSVRAVMNAGESMYERMKAHDNAVLNRKK